MTFLCCGLGWGWGGVWWDVNVQLKLLPILMLRWWWGRVGRGWVAVGWGWGRMLMFSWSCFQCWCYGDDGVRVPARALQWWSLVVETRDCAWSLFQSPMDAKNFVAKFERSSAQRQPRPAHCWWQGLDRYVPASLHNKVAKQVNARITTYVYPYVWRYHLGSHANLLAELASFA